MRRLLFALALAKVACLVSATELKDPADLVAGFKDVLHKKVDFVHDVKKGIKSMLSPATPTPTPPPAPKVTQTIRVGNLTLTSSAQLSSSGARVVIQTGQGDIVGHALLSDADVVLTFAQAASNPATLTVPLGAAKTASTGSALEIVKFALNQIYFAVGQQGELALTGADETKHAASYDDGDDKSILDLWAAAYTKDGQPIVTRRFSAEVGAAAAASHNTSTDKAAAATPKAGLCSWFIDAASTGPSTCDTGCCETLERCYSLNKCDSLSWARELCSGQPPGSTVNLGALGSISCDTGLDFFVSGECSQCSNVAVTCIATGCSTVEDPAVTTTCNDAKCGTTYTCPNNGCSTPEECCSCQVPGAACNATATSCGNGVCDTYLGETPENCPVDCVYSTGCAAGEISCGGSCYNPLTSPLNCGACGTGCGSNECVNGRCSVQESVTWNIVNTSPNPSLSTAVWKTDRPGGLSLSFAPLNTASCGGAMPDGTDQRGEAHAQIIANTAYAIIPTFSGWIPHASGSNGITLFLDGVKILEGALPLDIPADLCQMARTDSILGVKAPPFVIGPGRHTFDAVFRTIADNVNNANVTLSLSFAPWTGPLPPLSAEVAQLYGSYDFYGSAGLVSLSGVLGPPAAPTDPLQWRNLDLAVPFSSYPPPVSFVSPLGLARTASTLFVASTTGPTKACKVTNSPANGSTVPFTECVDTTLRGASYVAAVGTTPSRLIATVSTPTPDIVTCPLTGVDAAPLGACTSAGVGTFSSSALPTGIAANAGFSRLYIGVFDGGAPGTSSVMSCVLTASTGGLSSCRNEGSATALPGQVQQVLVSPAGDALFLVVVSDPATTALWSCDIVAATGALSNCAANSFAAITGLPNPLVFGGGLAATGSTLFASIQTKVYLSCVMSGRTLTACAVTTFTAAPGTPTTRGMTVY